MCGLRAWPPDTAIRRTHRMPQAPGQVRQHRQCRQFVGTSLDHGIEGRQLVVDVARMAHDEMAGAGTGKESLQLGAVGLAAIEGGNAGKAGIG